MLKKDFLSLMLLMGLGLLMQACGAPQSLNSGDSDFMQQEEVRDIMLLGGESTSSHVEENQFAPQNLITPPTPANPLENRENIYRKQNQDPSRFFADWDSQPKAKEWTQMTLKALYDDGGDLLNLDSPGDAGVFCPRYNKLTERERLQFYLMLISSMARHESSFDPKTEYVEKMKDLNGENVVSRGLLQISIESGNGYGCEIQSESELHEPKKNLKCGVTILNRWIKKDNRLGSYGVSPHTGEYTHLGGNRYWAVLRKDKWGRADIREKTKTLEFCQ